MARPHKINKSWGTINKTKKDFTLDQLQRYMDKRDEGIPVGECDIEIAEYVENKLKNNVDSDLDKF